jgi:hypothetical protein
MTLMGLGAHLSTGAANDPQAFMAWSSSEEGKEFMTRSSGKWADASIASGTPEPEAREAAGRTTAFYTGG